MNPCKEVNDAAPNRLEDFVGQRRVVDQLKVAIQAARNDDKRLPSMLLSDRQAWAKRNWHIFSLTKWGPKSTSNWGTT